MTNKTRLMLALSGVAALLLAVPGAVVRSDAKTKAGSRKIAWRNSFAAAQAEARRTGKPIMVDFYATWCGPCQELDKSTWTSAKVANAARGFVPVKVNVDKSQAFAFRYKATSLPYIVFMLPDGRPVHSIGGYVDADRAVRMMKTAATRAKVKSRPRVLTAQLPR